MKLTKPIFWKSKNIISILLLPLTIFTLLINISKRIYLKKNFSIKTICVGNIFLGGTGKTSLAMEIQELLGKKFKTVFIKKYYQNQIDEINLLKNRGDVISKKNRENALSLASKKYDLAILDDGLQQKNINYGLKIVCFNTNEGLGNEFLLPAGPLRESVGSLKDYDIAFLNGENKNNNLLIRLKSINKNLKIFEGKYKPKNINRFNLKNKYLMFCGIGNPHEFTETLKKYKFKITKKIIFPDHYKISPHEIKELKTKAKNEDLSIITTEKDFFRLDKLERKNIKFLKIKLEVNNLKYFKKILTSQI